MGHRVSVCLAGLVAAVVNVEPALAQSETSALVETALPDNYDRDRNVSVLERPRPDYDPIGIITGGFKILPRATIGGGFSNNVYASATDKISDGYASFAPFVSAKSDWAVHQVSLQASGNFNRYFSEPRRNENNFDLRGLGQLDFGSSFRLTGEAQYAQLLEQQDLGAISANLAVLSRYRRAFVAGRAEYLAGKSRLALAVDHTWLDFRPIPLGNNVFIDQSDRNRGITRITGQAQHALSPSIAVYAQLTYSDTIYDRDLLSGFPNRDSQAYRAIAGVNFDLAGFLRGKIGVGYVQRDYKSALYRDIGGFSTEAKIEYFPTELTTVTLQVGRTIEDAGIGTTSSSVDTRAQLRVDHELLRNLLLNLNTDFARQAYRDIQQTANNYRVSFGARYLSSRWLSLNLGTQYFRRDLFGSASNNKYREWRTLVGITIQR